MTANPLSTIPPIGPTTGVAPPAHAGRFKPIDPVRLARTHAHLLIFTLIFGLGAGFGTWYLLRKEAPSFESKASLLVSGSSVSNVWDGQTNEGPGSGSNVESYIANEINYIKSDEIVREAISKPEVQNSQWFATFNNDVRAASLEMQNEMLGASPARGTTLINLTMSCRYSGDVQDLLSAVISTYLNAKQITSQNDSAALRKTFIAEKERAADDVLRIKQSLASFLRDNEIDVVQGMRSDTENTYTQYSNEQVQLGRELDAANHIYTSLQQSGDAMEMTDEEYAYLKQLPNIASRESELISLAESRRVLMAGGKQASHPAVITLDHTVDAVRLELQREMDKEMGQLRAMKIQTAAKQAEALKNQMQTLEPKMREASRKLQDLTGKLTQYSLLRENLGSAQAKQDRAEASLDQIRVRGIRPDTVRIRPQVSPTDAELAFPKMGVIVPMVTLLLLGLVGGLITLREMLDQRVKSPMDVKLLPEINLLGLIPHATEDPSRGRTSAQRVVEESPTGLLAESYRQVRTAVLSKMERRGYKTLVCVSAKPESGTSTVVQNLAASLSYNNRSVVIVDANFRRPSQHTLIDAPNELGLVDLLNDRAELADVVVKHPGLDLWVLPTGQAGDSPPELLEGAAFRGLLGQLEAEYDFIIIDAPPALLTSDAQLLAKHVDAIAVVVHAGHDKRGMLMRMLGQLDGQRADVLGVILSGVKSAAGGYFRKSYEEFYRYGDTPSRTARQGKPARGGKKSAPPVASPADREPAAALAHGNGSHGSNGKPAPFPDADDSGHDLDDVFGSLGEDEDEGDRIS